MNVGGVRIRKGKTAQQEAEQLTRMSAQFSPRNLFEGGPYNNSQTLSNAVDDMGYKIASADSGINMESDSYNGNRYKAADPSKRFGRSVG